MFNVLSVNPSNNSVAIEINSVIFVTFNDFATNVTSNSLFLTKKGKTKKVSSTLVKISDDTWKIIPSQPLTLNTSYTVHATPEIINFDGESLTNFTSEFKTKYNTELPIILNTYPKNQALHVKVGSCIEIIFSEPVLNINEDSFFLRKIINGQENIINVEATIIQFSPTSWKLIPTVALDPSTDYIVRLTTDIVDDEGNSISATDIRFTTETNNVLPFIIDRDPIPDQIGVPINGTIFARFNEPIFNVSDQTVKLLKGTEEVTSIITNPDPDAIQILPLQDLEFNQTYEIRFNSIVDDGGNKTLTIPYKFTTQFNNELPQVIETLPASNETAVSVKTQIFIKFNKPVYNIDSTKLILKNSIDEIIPTEFIVRDIQNYILKPIHKLQPQETYIIEVDSSIVDDQNNAINFTPISFTTEYSEANPGVVNVIPYPGQLDVNLGSSIELTFNKPVYNVDFNSFTVTNLTTGVRPTGSYIQNENKWTFIPDDILDKGIPYRVILKKSITDDVERPLNPFSFTFNTESFESPVVKSVKYYTTDIDNTINIQDKLGNIPIDAKFLIEFNKPVVNIEGNIELNPGDYSLTTISDTLIELTPNTPLNLNTDYTITIDRSIKDDRNQALNSDFIVKITTDILPHGKVSPQLTTTFSDCLLTGGVLPESKLFTFTNNHWSISGLSPSYENIRNSFSIHHEETNQIFYLGGLSYDFYKTGAFAFDLTMQTLSEISLASQTPSVIDYAGLIKVWNSTTSQLEDHIITLGFEYSDTKVFEFDANTYSWSNPERIGSNKINQALGSFIWVEQGTSTSNCKIYILGGMSHKNNNLPVKQLQKVEFFIDGGSLKYSTSIIAGENHILFKSPLAFINGLRTNRIGNVAENRGGFNNYQIGKLRCEEVFPLSSGLFEKESQTFLDNSNLETNTLLTFFVNPPDGVIKPFIQVYITQDQSVRYGLPKIDFDYPYQNRVEFALTSLEKDTNFRTNKLILFGGQGESGNLLDSTWIIEPSVDTDANFIYNFTKISPFFTI